MTLLICIGVFFIGSIHPSLFGYWQDRIALAGPLGRIMPNLEYFYVLDTLVSGQPIPLIYTATAAAYCACFSAGVLALACAMFERRQLEGQGTSASMPGPVGIVAWAGRLAAILMVVVGIEGILSLIVSMYRPDFQPLVMNSLKQAFFSENSPDSVSLIPAGGLTVGAVAVWMLAGAFGRGRSWSYWVACALTAAQLLRVAAVKAELTRAVALGGFDEPVLLGVQAIVAAAVMIVLFLPKTRRHFR